MKFSKLAQDNTGLHTTDIGTTGLGMLQKGPDRSMYWRTLRIGISGSEKRSTSASREVSIIPGGALPSFL
jgi:hypothetical protein